MDKVYCPYCNSEMRLHYESYVRDDGGIYYYVCTNKKCFSHSPINEEKELAIAAAIRRPLQKPLTLEEFQESGFAFIELNEEHYESYVFPAFYVAKVNGFWTALLTKRTKMITDFFDKYEENEILIENNEYGMAWRCWATKPSDAERTAAAWEE